MRIDRLKALVDGAMAIVLTILVLLIDPPPAHQTDAKILDYLQEQWHILLAYALSFMLIGIHWLNHYTIFHFVKKLTLPLIWLNLLFLLFVSFIPFPTALYVEYSHDEFAVVIYSGVQLLASLTLIVMWSYLDRHPELIELKLDENVVRKAKSSLVVVPGIYLIAIVLSFFNHYVALGLLVLVPIYRLAVGRYYFLWSEKESLIVDQGL